MGFWLFNSSFKPLSQKQDKQKETAVWASWTIPEQTETTTVSGLDLSRLETGVAMGPEAPMEASWKDVEATN